MQISTIKTGSFVTLFTMYDPLLNDSNQNLFNALHNMNTGLILLETELQEIVAAVLKDHPQYERAVEIVRDCYACDDGIVALEGSKQFVKDYPE